MLVKSLVSLFLLSSLAAGVSHAATPAAPGGASVDPRSQSPIVVPNLPATIAFGGEASSAEKHGKGLPPTGLIMVGNPPSKLTWRPGGVRPPLAGTHGKGLPPTGLIMVGNPPSKLMGGLIGVGNFSGRFKGGFGAGPGGSASGRARSVTWIAQDGSSLTMSFPADVDLADVAALVAPEGEWVDVELSLSSALYLDGEADGVPYGLTLEVDTLTIPLETPISSDGTAAVQLTIELPDFFVDELLAADGLVVEPGDALHDELAEAVRSSAWASAR